MENMGSSGLPVRLRLPGRWRRPGGQWREQRPLRLSSLLPEPPVWLFPPSPEPPSARLPTWRWQPAVLSSWRLQPCREMPSQLVIDSKNECRVYVELSMTTALCATLSSPSGVALQHLF